MGSTAWNGASSSNALNGSASASGRSSPAVGNGPSSGSSKPKGKVNSNGYHPPNPNVPLSSLTSAALDLTLVERRGHPTEYKEARSQPKSRPSGIPDAPTFFPNEEEWRDPLTYIKSITPEAQEFGICKIVPPKSWNPGFAIDTEVSFHGVDPIVDDASYTQSFCPM